MVHRASPAELRRIIGHADWITVLTGSGVSAESGIPTFRDAQSGLWANYDPEQLATPQAFERNPELVWNWYQWRRELIGAARPNAAHHALVDLETIVPHFTLITQNIDGLHQQAGSQNVVELHGNIGRSKCSLDGREVAEWTDRGKVPPECPRCGGLLRPDVVWFGESLPKSGLRQAVEAARRCDVFLAVGTSALVQPAASLPLEARDAGGVLIEINLATTSLTPLVDYALTGPAAVVLPELVRTAFYSRDPGLY
jgi:NAD-dependent deacetylase